MLMIPLAAACLLAYLLAAGRLRKAGARAPCREALLWSFTGLGLFILLCTEGFGALRLLTPPALAAGWSMLALALAASVYRVRTYLRRWDRPAFPPVCRSESPFLAPG